jgi:hypothetical protein
MTARPRWLLGATLLLATATASCGKSDAADSARKEVRAAGAAVEKERDNLATEQEEATRNARELLEEQRAVAAKQATVEKDRRELGSAQGSLADARATYDTAVKQRFARLDVALDALSRRTDTAALDAAAGLRTRRDLLASRIATMPVETAGDWGTYTRDLDTTFEAIERDLRDAK